MSFLLIIFLGTFSCQWFRYIRQTSASKLKQWEMNLKFLFLDIVSVIKLMFAIVFSN